jgi:RNA polymerase sigma-70 factor (ECF subfamily)
MRIIELNRQNNARAKRQQNYAEYSIDGLLNIEEVNIRGETDKIKKRALKNAVKRLSDRQREVVYLKFYEGFTNDEIAGVMEIKKQSVYNLIFESLRKLEEYLNYI